jgi:hypothetical protein
MMRPEDWLKRHAKDMPATSATVSLLLKIPILYIPVCGLKHKPLVIFLKMMDKKYPTKGFLFMDRVKCIQFIT